MSALPHNFRPDAISSEVWMGVGGVMLVLLRSIVDGSRRTAAQLLVGCIFGGLGASAAAFVWKDSHYVYFICGVAAVITENVIIGVTNMSKEFAEKPQTFFGWAWKLIVPTIPFLKAGATGVVPDATTPAAPNEEAK